jgi:hypothetical protein
MTESTGGPPRDPAGPPPASAPPAPEPPAAAPAPAPAPASGFQAPAPASASGFQVPVEAGPAPGVVYADLTTRIIAYVIDAILYGVIFGIVFAIVGAIAITSLIAGGAILALLSAFILAALSLIGSAVYFVWSWTNLRASPGQKILSLETVNAGDGSTLGRDQAIRRWAFLFGPSALALPLQLALTGTGLDALSSLVSLAVFGYTIYLLYTAAKSPKRQGFHDAQASTVVVKRVAA